MRYISLREADLVSNFIAAHGAEITLPIFRTPEVKGLAYTTFADLLLLLKHHSILDILDNHRSLLIHILEDLRHIFRFRGRWLDSLEILVVDNAKNDSRHLKKLMNVEKRLKRCNDKITRKWARKGTGSMRFMRKFVKSKLANAMGKRKVVSNARKSLNFFYYST